MKNKNSFFKKVLFTIRRAILILMILTTTHIFSQNIKNYSERSDEDRIIHLTYSLNFDKAIELVEKKKSDNSGSLQWKYFHAMISWRKIYHLVYQHNIGYLKDQSQISSLKKSFFDELTEMTQIGDRVIKENPKDTLALFYTGAGYGYLGMYYASLGENMKGASVGMKGLDYHEKLIELCPNWGDVYLSKGLFNYYTSNIPWYIKPILWILGMSGTESNAQKYLKMTIDKGQFAKYEAMEMLARLYIRQEKPDLAFIIVDELIREFPESKYYYIIFGAEFGNKGMLAESDKLLTKGINLPKSETLSDLEKIEIGTMYSFLAQYYFAAKEYNKVIELGKELMDRKIMPRFDSWGHLVQGNAYLELGNKTKASEHYNWVLMNSSNEKHKTIAKEKLSKL